jgi:hydroxyacylglutathione hydrolase
MPFKAQTPVKPAQPAYPSNCIGASLEYARRMILERRAVEPFFKNGFVIGCEDTREGVLIDPGDEVDQLLLAIAKHGLSITSILLTHAHLDHVTGVGKAKRALGAPVWLHKDDNFLYQGVVQQGQMFGLRVEPQPAIDSFYAGEGPLRFGRYAVRVLHTPGHCPGGVCLAVSKDGERTSTLFVGDTLFAGSIGRTDLPGGDLKTLLRSIREVLFTFPDDTVVWSGHGEETTIGREKRTNPFLQL